MIYEVILKSGEKFRVKAKDVYINDIGVVPTIRFEGTDSPIYVDGKEVVAVYPVINEGACG